MYVMTGTIEVYFARQFSQTVTNDVSLLQIPWYFWSQMTHEMTSFATGLAKHVEHFSSLSYNALLSCLKCAFFRRTDFLFSISFLAQLTL